MLTWVPSSVSISGSGYRFQTWLYLWHPRLRLPYHGDAYGNLRTYLEFLPRKRSSSNACGSSPLSVRKESSRELSASESPPSFETLCPYACKKVPLPLFFLLLYFPPNEAPSPVWNPILSSPRVLLMPLFPNNMH
ncbi:hypothetical protein VNO77_08611 [Canavalia gladiata]|uniref:Uncharacterized protein n=1 Tax=Canavalia gladiata TaxID=3824 RepID=A0AAN9QW90_CANGL